jgi:hypothetical protein
MSWGINLEGDNGKVKGTKKKEKQKSQRIDIIL